MATDDTNGSAGFPVPDSNGARSPRGFPVPDSARPSNGKVPPAPSDGETQYPIADSAVPRGRNGASFSYPVPDSVGSNGHGTNGSEPSSSAGDAGSGDGPTAPAGADKGSLDDLSRSDREVVRLARGGSFSVVAQVAAQAALLVMTMTLTNFLPTGDVGRYASAHALAAILSLVALIGMRSALPRYVAMHRLESDVVRGLLYVGIGATTFIGAAMGAAIYARADWLADSLFDDPDMAIALRWAGLILPATTLLTAAISATQGWRNVRPFNFVKRLLEPGARLLTTVVILSLGGGLNAAMAVSAISTSVAGLVAVVWVRKLVGSRTEPTRYVVRPFMKFAFVSWGAAFAAQGLLWADILMIGWFRPSSDVAIYQIASRIALLASLSIAPINSVLGPRLADLFNRNKTEEALAIYRLAAEWALRLTLPAAATVLFMPDAVLSVFGPEYTAGVVTIFILLPGQLFNASTASSATILNMAGENAITLWGNLAILAINLGLNAVLIPRVGIEGAAIAWCVSLLVVNVYRVFMINRRIGPAWLWSRSTIFALVSAAAAGGITLGALELFFGGPTKWTVVPGGLAILLLYVGAQLRWGITEEDRLIGARFLPSRSNQKVATAA